MCAAAQALPGVSRVDYDAQLDRFSLEYDPERVSLADIFAAVVLGGKKMGQEYRPRLLE